MSTAYTAPSYYPERRPMQPAPVYALPTREVPMTTEPEVPSDPPRKNRTPHKMNMGGTYTYSVHGDLLWDHLRMARRLKEIDNEPFSFEAAVASYILDAKQKQTKGKADYKRIWGWSEQQLRSRWEELKQTAREWLTCYGRMPNGLSGESSKNANGRPTDDQRNDNSKQADSSAQSQSSNGRPTDDQRTTNGHTTELGTSNSSKAPLPPASGGESAEAEKEKAERLKAERAARAAAKRERERQAAVIYEAYPLKKARPVALRAIAKALQSHSFEFLLERTEAYNRARNGDMHCVPNPSTWFNQCRFNDDPSTWVRTVLETNNTPAKTVNPGGLNAYKVRQ
jgi:hypothetical protein